MKPQPRRAKTPHPVRPEREALPPASHFATCPRGLEALLEVELAVAGAQVVRQVPAGVLFMADAAAEMAGVQRITYPPNVSILRMNCSARFDPYHILWAFLNGADGVFLGACPPGQCHYGIGNLYAQERVEKLKNELTAHGVDPDRLCLKFLTLDNGKEFAQAVQTFVDDLSTRIPHKQG